VSGWLIAEQATRYSEAIKALPQHQRAIAPALLPMEYTKCAAHRMRGCGGG